jgi:hypothetical protein
MVGIFLMLMFSHLEAQNLPPANELTQQLGDPQPIKVYEPSWLNEGKKVEVIYLGYPISKVIDYLMLNNQFHDSLEFVCQDGYVSRIPVQAFKKHQAYLVFERADNAPFVINHHTQQQPSIPLSPYYLVWDNRHSKVLQKRGAYHWPYQVIAINEMENHKDTPSSKLAKEYCLSCHQLNGRGGELLPINLAQIGKRLSEEAFMEQVLHPLKLNPESKMPPLNPQLASAERVRIARALYRYFNQIEISQ